MEPRRYRITGTILLSFDDGREQSDVLITADSALRIEATADTVWVVDRLGKRHESITTANVVEHLLRDKRIEEVEEANNGRAKS